MKRKFIVILGVLLLCTSLWARTPEEAAAIASGFMSQKGTQENVVQRVRKAKSVSVAPSTVSLEYTQFTTANENAVYVFNHVDEGFVMVSAKDDSREVLGYSDNGHFDKNDIPESMQFWLQMYASELARADVNKPVLKSGQTAIKRAPKTPAASYPVITPILGNVMWGQNKPYNNLCPVVNGERCVTGCVATAISQIMYVHKHPIKGTGSHSYTTKDGIYASADFGSTTYDWNNMLPSYSNNYNATQANAVATLMYHVGVAVDMGYGPGSSGAKSSLALTRLGTHFGYDKGIKKWPKEYMNEEEILSAVASDLSIGHPVYISGATINDGGHAFVCDGMKSDGYIHINWGWNGVANGYFVLSALDPENQGTGGSASDMAYTEHVEIYTGIQPDQGGEAEPLVTVDAMTRTSADVISRNSKVSFSLNHFASAGMGTAKGTVCYYIYDTNDNLVETIDVKIFELETGYYYTNPITTSVAIPSTVANGEYKLEIGYTDNAGTIHPILVKGKGIERKTMTVSSTSIKFGTISYELNGGVTNEGNWLSKGDMWDAFMVDAGISVGTFDDVKADEDPFTRICGKLAEVNVKAIMDMKKWDWLEAYIMQVQNADLTTPATQLVAGTASAGWRYAIAAFFLESQRTSWPKSADFSQAGKVEAFIPAWKHAFANPTESTTEWVLNAPYKEGYTFDGWYATADFSSAKITTINATTTGTLYAKWIEYVPTIAEVKAMDDNTETRIGGVVNFISGKNVYIQDVTGGILLSTSDDPTFKVGERIIAKGVKVMHDGAPEVKDVVVVSAEAAELPTVVAFESLAALVTDTAFRHFATRVSVHGLKIVSYDSSNNPTVEDILGNKAVCYKMPLDPVAFPIGTKVNVDAIAGWRNGFQFVGDAAGINDGINREQYEYPTRGKFSLKNNWVLSTTEDNFAANKPGSNDYVRGMAAKDGIMYFINRETESIVRVDGATGRMLDPIKLTGDHLFQMITGTDPVSGEPTWGPATTLPYNDIKFDQAGNCLIGACVSSTSDAQPFMIYLVDLTTGKCTELINDNLRDNPGLDKVTYRFDAFGVAGDVTKNGVIMAADAMDGLNVYRWVIKNGVAGEGEQIKIKLNASIDQSLYIKITGFGTAPQILPQDEVGESFYVDGSNTLPMLFHGTPDKGATLVDDFIHVPTGTTVTNNPGEELNMNTAHNGLVKFQVGKDYFLLMAASNRSSSPASSFALYKFANADCLFKDMVPLWFLPHNGLGSVINGCCAAIPAVEVIDNSTAKFYLYTNNNGYACYTLSIDRSSDPVSEITYELNGGVTNDYGWMNKNDMFQACMADAGITTLASLDKLKAKGTASLSTICTPLGIPQAQAILDNAKWDWLEAYIMHVQNADLTTPATQLAAGTASAGWRYAIAAFFLENQRTDWPKSADFSQAGKVEAFMPAWKHAFDNPTYPTEEVVLNAPYKEGYTFDGWYATADFSGEKVMVVNRETIATLYAKWTAIPQETSEKLTICDGDSLRWNGKIYTESGEYTVRLTGVNGCDSVVTLYLTVNPITTTEKTIIACDSYEWNGQTYTESGNYVYTTVAANGCDSVEVLHLTILPDATTKSEELALCPSELPYEWYGQKLTEAGSYTATVQYAGMDCDSIIHELKVNVYVQTLPDTVSLPIVRPGEAIDVTIPTAEIQAHVDAEIWYAPNALVTWYILDNSNWARLTAEPVKAGTKQVVLKYAVETDCGNVESAEKVIIADETIDVENISNQLPITNCQKVLRNGQLLILRDGVEYNLMGTEIQ